MTTTTAVEPMTRTLEVPGATLTYDVRRNDATTEPPLFLIGAPMGAGGFPSLIAQLPERTIITYDPRGSERSVAHDPAAPITPDTAAEDLHAIVAELGGPVDVLASSGGAVNALAWVARYPNDVRTLVAHEPPLASVLPDREPVMASMRALHETYMRDGFGPAMAKFITLVSHTGPFTDELATAPAPDPHLVGYEPDFEALRRAPTRIVPAAGVESEGIMAGRGAFGVAERLGTGVAIFPGGHNGFMGGEYGQPPGDPAGFAAKLREVLAD
jgi:pimeloyl-ACP methyl ester carboxylesterase